MTLFMLAGGGIYLLPKNLMVAYMYADVRDAVGGLFSLMLVPGFAVGYAAYQSRIIGAIYFIGFTVLGFIGGVNILWIVTAVLLVLSYMFCIGRNVGNYDNLDIYDRICMLIPAFGALRFIDRPIAGSIFGTIGKILSFIATLLEFAMMFALWIIPKEEASTFGRIITHVKDFGGTLFGVIVIFFSCPFSLFTVRNIHSSDPVFQSFSLLSSVATTLCGADLL